MRTVRFDPNDLAGSEKKWWARYSKRADDATRDIICNWEDWLEKWLDASPPKRVEMKFEPEFRPGIWTRLKVRLFRSVFHGKCAYCETLITRFDPHAEHYRPKGKVRIVLSGKAIEAVVTEFTAASPTNTMPHPGYFWLAYHWRNLVPACSGCNSGSAKVDFYPVSKNHVLMKLVSNEDRAKLHPESRESTKWPGFFYLAPSDLDVWESPLLLNPLNPEAEREPDRHIRFGIKGIIAAIDDSPIGETTIRTLRLDEEQLRKERQREQENFHRLYFGKFSDPDIKDEDLKRVLLPYQNGVSEYSGAILDYFARQKERMLNAGA